MASNDAIAYKYMEECCLNCRVHLVASCKHYMDKLWWRVYFNKPYENEKGELVPRRKICGRFNHKAIEITMDKAIMIEEDRWE